MLAENLSVKIESVDQVLDLYRAGIIGLIDARVLLGLSTDPAEIQGLGRPAQPLLPGVPTREDVLLPNGIASAPAPRYEAPRSDVKPAGGSSGRPSSEKQQNALYAIAQGRYPDGSKGSKLTRFVAEVTGGRTDQAEDVTFQEASDAINRFGRKR